MLFQARHVFGVQVLDVAIGFKNSWWSFGIVSITTGGAVFCWVPGGRLDKADESLNAVALRPNAKVEKSPVTIFMMYAILLFI